MSLSHLENLKGLHFGDRFRAHKLAPTTKKGNNHCDTVDIFPSSATAPFSGEPLETVHLNSPINRHGIVKLLAHNMTEDGLNAIQDIMARKSTDGQLPQELQRHQEKT